MEHSRVTRLTADELAAEGRSLAASGTPVIFLHPSQEWMAVETQTPFMRYGEVRS